MKPRPLRLGTRRSRLALVQAGIVADAFRAVGARVELVEIVTSGDVREPETPWGEGAFVDALGSALLSGAIDAAIHSAKDVPIDGPWSMDLEVAAYHERADPRDVLVTRSGAASLRTLQSGSVIGTDSPRRTGFMLAARSDVRVIALFGNVDTRLERLERGDVDALILAAAGLDRLGAGHRIDQRLDPVDMPPAAGQGALAIQVRADDGRTSRAVRELDDADLRRSVEAERAVLATIGGGCRAPVGVLATVVDDAIVEIMAARVAPAGERVLRARASGPASQAMDLAMEVAESLVDGWAA